ncbi:MAG TPA: hypothetical protein VM509_00150 [Planctomycetota bacterium]|nr:hypothetical protein [Planctomycetota bacterium]
MKAVVDRSLLVIAILDLVLGAVIALTILIGITSSRAWTGAGCLFFGALGLFWARRQLFANPREVQP